MASILIRSFVVLAAVPLTLTSTVDTTPLNKVVQLLGDMKAKGAREKHDEEVEFAKFHQWCDSTRAETEKTIEEETMQITQLSADIEKAESDAEQLKADMDELEANIATYTTDLETATAIRKKEKADYDAAHKDFSESIDAAERAIDALKAKSKDVPQSFLQLQQSTEIPMRAKLMIQSFMEMGSDLADEAGAPEANAYEFQSGGVVGMLEKLRLKFQDQRLALEKEEMNAKHNYEVLEEKLTDDLKDCKAQLATKTEKRAGRLDEAAQAKRELEVTTKAKAEDEKKLGATNTECEMRSEEFEKNQDVRAGEIEAIAKALEILNSDDVQGPALIQRTSSRATALVQLGSTGENARERVAAFLQSQAKKLDSRYLALVATRVQSDPFGKVKQMIKELIVKLMEEANSEADNKGFCDTELSTNKQTRENKQSEIEELTATIEKADSDGKALAVQIAELSDAIAAIRKQQAEATQIRDEDRATNEKTIAEAKAAQVAVRKATSVLRDFYSAAGDNAFLQGQVGMRQEMAQAAREPYTGMQSASGGIMGFLEVILSDFARLESETSSAEDTAQSTYKKFMDESSEDAAVKATELEHNQARKQRVDAAAEGARKELALTQQELDAALEYYEKLKPDCVDTGLSYEERVRGREEEIQSLKEALRVLGQQDLA